MSDKTQLEQMAEVIEDLIRDSGGSVYIHAVTGAADRIMDICQPQCEWKMSNDGFYDVWESTCGNSFVLNEGSPEDNEMNYCSHCGGKLIQPIPEDTA